MSDETGASEYRSGREGWWAALLPGLPYLLRRRWIAGFGILAMAAFLAAVLVLGRERVFATLAGGGGDIDDWVAFATLTLGLGSLWGLSFAALRSGPGGDRSAAWSQWSTAAREFTKNRLAVVGLGALVVLTAVTLLAPYLAPYDPVHIGDVVGTRNLRPSLDHLMGTDKLGRDVFSRVLYGARISLAIGFTAIAIAITLGTAVGAAAGYFGGVVDAILMRIVDVLIAFPRLVLLIVVVSLLGHSVNIVIIVLGLTLWPSTARIVRGEVLSLREREFIQAARALGFGDLRIIARHVVPNVMAPVIVGATLGIGNVILIESGLSFLGLGVPIDVPTWGRILDDGRAALLSTWWVTTFPGLAIVYTVVAINLIGDGLRDALDPRLRM